ncbi:MAG: 2-nitropropane dioxygenase [Spirochaetes bacterium]|nr:MAG: 2-nitropropane dioxygenase [Spirochaetota bacterium]
MEKSKKLLDKLFKRGKEFLGVEYPILGGAMSWISEAKLVSTISNEGGFGVLAGGNMPIDLFKDEITKTSDMTDKPFGVNLISIAPNFRAHLDHVLDREFPYIIFAGGLPPRDAINKVKQTSSKMLCFAPTVGIAKRLIDMGVDALIIEGHEAGGHIGPVSTSVLAEQILPHTSEVPVFVAGGIGSGLLMIHYLMMGASGVQLGTRFAVSEESIAHPNFKQAFIKAASKDAMPTAQFDPRVPVIPVRSITNKGVEDFTTLQLGLIAQMQRGALTAREAGMQLEEFWIGGLRKAVIDGDIEHGSLMAGQSVGIVSEIQSVHEIIHDMVERGIQESDRILSLINIKD